MLSMSQISGGQGQCHVVNDWWITLKWICTTIGNDEEANSPTFKSFNGWGQPDIYIGTHIEDVCVANSYHL